MIEDLAPSRGMAIALAAYKAGKPVAVFSRDEVLLHGEKVSSVKARKDQTKVFLDASTEEWNSSEWPEIFAAVRKLLLTQRLKG